MKALQCSTIAPLPWWTSRAISAAIFVVSFIAFIIFYTINEKHKKRHFYGRMDQMSESERKEMLMEEKRLALEMEEAAIGPSYADYVVTPDENGRMKVWISKKDRKRSTGKKDKENGKKKPTVTVPGLPENLVLQVITDKTGRGEELLEQLRKKPVTSWETLSLLGEILDNILDKIEKMTFRDYFCLGYIPSAREPMMRGGQIDMEDLYLQMRIQLVKPFPALIAIYQIEVAEPRAPNPTPRGIEGQQITEILNTDLTPSTTPHLPAALPKTSALTNIDETQQFKMTMSDITKRKSKKKSLISDEMKAPPPSLHSKRETTGSKTETMDDKKQ